MTFDIRIERPDTEDIVGLLAFHLSEAHRVTPEGLSFALPIDALCAEDITFWTARERGKLAGVCALKALDDVSGEIKSMRTDSAFMRRGVAAALLEEVIRYARLLGFGALYLETGRPPSYAPAQALYKRFGFQPCEAFADYKPSEFNVFFKLAL